MDRMAIPGEVVPRMEWAVFPRRSGDHAFGKEGRVKSMMRLAEWKIVGGWSVDMTKSQRHTFMTKLW